MGYRSEVAYVIRFKDKEMKDNFINLQRAKADQHINTALDELIEVEDNMLGYHADHVKWYESYPDVMAHQQLLKDTIAIFANDETVPDYDNQAGYKFIRLGEEQEDNIDEEEGNSEELYDYVDWYRGTNISFKRNTWEKPEGEEA
jgi:hypothetical protein